MNANCFRVNDFNSGGSSCSSCSSCPSSDLHHMTRAGPIKTDRSISRTSTFHYFQNCPEVNVTTSLVNVLFSFSLSFFFLVWFHSRKSWDFSLDFVLLLLSFSYFVWFYSSLEGGGRKEKEKLLFFFFFFFFLCCWCLNRNGRGGWMFSEISSFVRRGLKSLPLWPSLWWPGRTELFRLPPSLSSPFSFFFFFFFFFFFIFFFFFVFFPSFIYTFFLRHRQKGPQSAVSIAASAFAH